MPPPFGYTYTLDVYGAERRRLGDVGLAYRYLDALVEDLLHMTRQSPPYVFRSPEQDFPDKVGISAWVPLIESGIQLHTLEIQGFLSLDVYSCARFDPTSVLEFTISTFGGTDHESRQFIRGKRFHEFARRDDLRAQTNQASDELADPKEEECPTNA